MSTHISPPCLCPVCTHPFNRATNAENGVQEEPSPGDLSICVECETVLAFTDQLTLRKATDEEIKEGTRLIMEARANLKKFRKGKR